MSEPDFRKFRGQAIRTHEANGGFPKRMFLSTHIQHWPIDRLIPYARNARTHSAEQVAQVAASIREFGFTSPILIDGDSGVIAGHARLLAARKLGLTEVPVVVLDHFTAAQKRAYVLADNQLALNANWDEEMLAAEVATLREDEFDLSLLGFEDEEMERLLDTLDSPLDADENAAPEVEEVAVSRPGDLWLLGTHRVLCGDALSRADIDRVLDGQPAHMVFTDPPYNVDYAPEDRDGNARRIANDNLGGDFPDFLSQVCTHLVACSKGAIYIAMSSSELHTLKQAFCAAGGHWSTFLIWAKDRFTLGRSDYQRQYEPILYGWPEGKPHYWAGARNQGDVWNIARPFVNDLHPTMKPVELVERAIANSSRRGETVLDVFGGSGTTAIACEKTERKGRLIELDPKYVDVIVKRWQDQVRKQAVLEADGRTFEEIAAERLAVAV